MCHLTLAKSETLSIIGSRWWASGILNFPPGPMIARPRHCLCDSTHKKKIHLCKYLEQIWNGVEQRIPSFVDSVDNIGISDLWILRILAFKILFLFCTPPTGILQPSKVIPWRVWVRDARVKFKMMNRKKKRYSVDTTPMSCLCNPSSSWRLCSINSWLINCNSKWFLVCSLCPTLFVGFLWDWRLEQSYFPKTG